MSDLAPETSDLMSVEGSPEAPLVSPLSQAVVAPLSGNGLAVAGFVLGITCVIFCWWGIFALIQVVLAITFSGVGRSHAKRGAPHGGLATAGLILGIVGAVLYFLIGVFSFGAGFFI